MRIHTTTTTRCAAAVAALALAAPASATSWCVRDHVELQQALTAAAASPGDDEIRLREGVYTTFQAPFLYAAQTSGWLTLSGGWYAVDGNDCAQRRMDASRTILDGAGQHQVLRIFLLPQAATNASSRLTVANLSVRNGYGDSATFQRGGGIDMSSYSDGYAELWLENVVVAQSEGYFGGGANLYAKYGTVRIANSLFDDNSASATAHGHASITVLGTAENVSPAVVIANSTFARGRCAGQGWRGCGIGAGLGAGVHLSVVNSLFFDNTISDLNLEGLAAGGSGDGSASADYSRIEVVSGNLPLAATNALVGDPSFVDADNGDFRLRDDSPFINRGLAGGPHPPLAVLDLDAQPRHRFGATDPGPYENQTWDFLFTDGFD